MEIFSVSSEHVEAIKRLLIDGGVYGYGRWMVDGHGR